MSKVSEVLSSYSSLSCADSQSSKMDIPKTHKAVVYDKPGEISTNIVDVETPAPGSGEVLVKMYARYNGIYSSNTHVHV